MIYDGIPLTRNDVELGFADVDQVLTARMSDDYAAEITGWASVSAIRADILYFAVSWKGRLVGHVFLHDWDREARTSLVGYHLFEETTRGLGIGTTALRLLQQYATDRTNLETLIAITTDDNLASRGLGRKCGFHEIGPSREDAVHGIVMTWSVPRPKAQVQALEG